MARSRGLRWWLATLIVAAAGCASEARRVAPSDSTRESAANAPVDARIPTLSGRVTTPDGAPIEGAEVEARTYAGRGLAELIAKELDPLGTVAASARSDTDGRFALPIDVRGTVDVLVSKPGLASVVLEARLPGDELACVLEKPATLAGRVVESDGGAPIAGARIDLYPHVGAFPRSRAHATTSAVDGSFEFVGLPPGVVRAMARASAHTTTGAGVIVELRAGERASVELKVARGVSARVRVIESVNRAPIEGANVGLFGEPDDTRTDAQGFATLVGAWNAGQPTRVSVRAPGFGTVSRRLGPPTPGAEFAIELERAVELHGELMSSSGRPLAHARVVAISSGFQHVVAESDAVGRFELPELNPANDFALLCSAPGFALRFVAVPMETLHAGRMQLGRFAVEPASRLIGRVVDERGAPCPHAWFSLGPWPDAEGNEPDPLVARHAMRSISVDGLGRFVLDDLSAGTYNTTVGGKGVATSLERLVTLAPGEEVDLGALVWPQKLSIRGRVVDARGDPRIGVTVSAHRGSVSDDWVGATYGFTLEDGEFEMRGLDDAAYELRLTGAFGVEALRDLVTVVVRPGEPARTFVYDVAARLAGRALARDGTPLANAQVWLVKGTQSDECIYTDRAGRFDLRFPYLGEVELRVVPYDAVKGDWPWTSSFDAGRFTLGDERELVLRQP